MRNSRTKITGLWKEETKDGTKYYSAKINKYCSLQIFENTKKTKKNEPDATLYMVSNLMKAKNVSEEVILTETEAEETGYDEKVSEVNEDIELETV